jgi:phosphoglycerate dehydrogenase-like enzyme
MAADHPFHQGGDRVTAPRILFLDDDPVIRVLRMVLSNAEQDPWLRDYFAPEEVDFAPLIAAAKGLRRGDGAAIGLSDLEDATAIIFRRGKVTADLIQRHPRLRLIQRFGERSEDIDLKAAAARGVRVSCFPRPTLNYTAEHVVLLMLALGKRLLIADRAVREGSPNAAKVPGVDGSAYNWVGLAGATGVHSRTLGIVGLGEVGTLVAKIARGLGMKVLYNKRHPAAPEVESALGVQFAALNELLGRSDYVSLNASNVPENTGLANSAFFSAMRRSAFFINTSRGHLVNEDHLYDALRNGTIAGAGLDVHAAEPRPARDRFASLPNVIVTPHVGGGAKSGLLDEFAVLARNCHAAFKGDAVLHEVR